MPGSTAREGFFQRPVVLVPVLYLVIFFLVPLARILSLSIYDKGLTLRHFAALVQQPAYLKIMYFTFQVSVVSTLITLLLAYPVAYLISRVRAHTASILLVFVVVPLFTSGLIRAYAWATLLAPRGVINQLLSAAGLVDAPLKLMYNAVGLYTANIHIILPYMILCLLSVMRGIDTRLVAAAMTLGARPSRAFLDVFLPLSIPGIVAGCVVVFVLSMGAYIIPAMLGGPRQMMIAMIIETEVMEYLHWGFSAALASVLLTFTMILLYAQQRYVGGLGMVSRQ
jgi:putative spermidine/putrescine transport system permease protein